MRLSPSDRDRDRDKTAQVVVVPGQGFNDRVLSYTGRSGNNKCKWEPQPRLTSVLAPSLANHVTFPRDQMNDLLNLLSPEETQILSDLDELRSFLRMTFIRILQQGDSVALVMEDPYWTGQENSFAAPGLACMNQVRCLLLNTGLQTANGKEDLIALVVRTRPSNFRCLQVMRFFPSSELDALASHRAGYNSRDDATNSYFWTHCMRDYRGQESAVQAFGASAFAKARLADRKADYLFHPVVGPVPPEILMWNPNLPIVHIDEHLRTSFSTFFGGSQQLSSAKLQAAISKTCAMQKSGWTTLALHQFFVSINESPRVQLLLPIAYTDRALDSEVSFNEWQAAVNFYLPMSFSNGCYVVHTILAARTAIQNARVVARPRHQLHATPSPSASHRHHPRHQQQQHHQHHLHHHHQHHQQQQQQHHHQHHQQQYNSPLTAKPSVTASSSSSETALSWQSWHPTIGGGESSSSPPSSSVPFGGLASSEALPALLY